jgi:hypothetical protein
MKLRSTILFIRNALILALVIVLALDFCGEFGLIPRKVIDLCETRLRQRGLRVSLDGLRIGLFRGVFANGVRLDDALSPHHRLLEVEQVWFRPDLNELFRGRAALAQAKFSGGRLFLPAAESAGQPPLTLDSIEARLSLAGRTLSLDACSARLRGSQLQLQGKVLDLQLPTARKALSWQTLLEMLSPEQRDHWEKTQRFLRAQTFPRHEGALNLEFLIPAEGLSQGKLFGAFSFSDFTIKGHEVRKLKGEFRLSREQLELAPLSVFSSGGDVSQAEIQLMLPEKRVSGRAWGDLEPRMLLRLLPPALGKALLGLEMPTPAKFAFSLKPSPYDMASWQGRLSLNAANFTFRQLPVNLLQLEAELEENRCVVKDAKLVLAGAQSEELSAALVFSPDQRRLSGSLNGTVFLLKRLPQLGLALPPALAHLSLKPDAQPDRLSLTLQDSPLNQSDLRVQGELDLRSLQLGRQPVHQLTGHFSLSPGQLVVNELQMVLDSPAKTSAATGEIRLDLLKHRLQASLRGSLKTSELNGMIPDKLRLKRIVDNLYSEALNYSVTLADSPWQPTLWAGDGTIAADMGQYEELLVQDLRGKLSFNPDLFVADLSSGGSVATGPLQASCRVNLKTGELRIQGHAVADPLKLNVFVPAGRARQAYDKVWRGFEWSTASPPDISLNSLILMPRRGNKPYNLSIDGGMHSVDCAYRGQKLDRLSGQVNLRLPQQVKILEIKARQGSQELLGELLFSLGSEPTCRFSGHGLFDPWLVLGTISPSWMKLAPSYDFASNSRLNFRGLVPLRDVSATEASGTLDTPSTTVLDYPFTNLRTNWQWRDGHLQFPDIQANLHEGTCAANVDCDLIRKQGHIQITLEDVQLKTLVKSSALKGEAKLAGTCNLKYDSSGEVMTLDGPGNIHLSEANLWEIPFFGKLGNLLSLGLLKRAAGLGRISTLDANLEFNGTAVKVPEFSTNGTILSLKGDGVYQRPNQEMNFRVQGILLKQTYFIPLATRLLSWIFEAELHGTASDPEWKLISALRRSISDE